ncbi:MAG: DUF1987 domain-containing protein [Bacteroidales bacterium]|jgi:hypothetical protein|nr:DUF1987 domain-containing protein [Bacteroidales bacterium]MBR6279118.1 DUF1987 domain-containing protein [Bacteroidales bacterium]
MERIQIDPLQNAPRIDFDPDNGVLLFEGKSLMEDSEAFYLPLVNWIIEYAKAPHKGTVVNFRYDYFNTSSSKWLITITKQLKLLYDADPTTTINWYWPDDDILEYGEVIRDLVDMPINLIEIESEDEDI